MQTMASLATWTDVKAGSLPVLAEAGAGPADQETLQSLRRFHLTGPSPDGKAAWLDRDILPALLHPYRDPASVRMDYPLFLPPPGSAVGESPCIALPDFMKQMAPADGARILRDNLLRLERAVRRAMGEEGALADARRVFQEAGTAVRRSLKLGKADDEAFASDLETLIAAIPEKGRLLPLGEHTAFALFGEAAEDRFRPARAAFLSRVREVSDKTRAVLEKDRMKRPESKGRKPETRDVGAVGSRYFDPSALSAIVRSAGGGAALPEDRRERWEAALEILDRDADTGIPDSLVLIHDGSLSKTAEAKLPGWTIERSDDPCVVAAERFDEAADVLAGILRAERLARLEYDGDYDHDVHGPWLARLDWHAFSREELSILPPVVAVLSADSAAGPGLLSLSRLILSGRPVHVIVLDHPAHNPGMADEEWGGFRFEPGYLAMSHREVWVQQTTVARPRHMTAGFGHALRGVRTALHVVACGFDAKGNEPRLGPWFFAGAAVESRAFACFRYNPEAGNSWARRLDFSGNPEPEENWPVYELTARRQNGGEETLALPFTFADFALLDPAYVRHFRLVPDGIPEADLVSLPAYLDLSTADAVRKIPFIWGVDGRGTLRRLAVTRLLALAARDRLGYWRTLQELAGLRNEYVQEAVKRAQEDAEARAREERERLEARHAEALERVRRDAAEDVVNQLTAALLDVDISGLAVPGIPGFQGMSVDEVTQALLAAVRPETLDAAPGEAPPERVERAASELMDMIDPRRLEENSR
jgi:hypothetical protein